MFDGKVCLAYLLIRYNRGERKREKKRKVLSIWKINIKFTSVEQKCKLNATLESFIKTHRKKMIENHSVTQNTPRNKEHN